MNKNNNKKKAIVIGGTKGMGRAIASSLQSIGCEVIATSSSEIDTSNLKSVKKFAALHDETDILVLNTGGPPPKNFFEIGEEEWLKYHNQLFLGFCLLLQKIKIRPGGYIFLISSHVIKEPHRRLIISNAYRTAFASVLKTLSKPFAAENISTINIAPGPIKTERLAELKGNKLEEYEKTLPMGRAGDPNEIGRFIKAIIENDIKYLTGVTINIDGGLSNFLF